MERVAHTLSWVWTPTPSYNDGGIVPLHTAGLWLSSKEAKNSHLYQTTRHWIIDGMHVYCSTVRLYEGLIFDKQNCTYYGDRTYKHFNACLVQLYLIQLVLQRCCNYVEDYGRPTCSMCATLFSSLRALA